MVNLEPSWTSPPLAVFEALAATIEARFGPPSERGLDSNGLGLFDAHCLRFPCGLEVALWRFHLGAHLQAIDPAIEALVSAGVGYNALMALAVVESIPIFVAFLIFREQLMKGIQIAGLKG